MQTNALYKALGLSLAALLVTACSSKDVKEEEGSTVAQVETATNTVDQAALDAAAREAAAREAQAALLAQTVFYFDFDQSTIKAESKAALTAHAAYLAANSTARVVLEGHADERGTVEYNLALGERRGEAVRRFLLANGAAAGQIEVVSYGEERPAVSGHDESSYEKNRRVEIKYQSR
ncbi:peptidoglycan-associated lipoprotein Pal [Parathalassolituus penaei]|uniref:Peptidoglycan-associated protein n=1 Tax=Parathalassolituus penaei TaxID=2997323 RepID=A0A9X3EJE8_9GAMM|nr:peptidoglycan-associated lipoprotein Pal [Parathalassolituus penaei]MCY0963628.1 peptidoglycan-associated lipoprotein Pal [Parathalassolituus penaei]